MSTYQHFYHEKETYGLNLNFCGEEICGQGHSFGPSIRSLYLFHYIVEGCGQYRVNGKEYHLSKNQGFIILPGDSTLYTADHKQPWTYRWFAFSGDDAKKLVSLCNLNTGNHSYRPSDPKTFKNLLNDMIEGSRQEETHYLCQLSRLYGLLGLIASDQTSINRRTTDYIDTATDFIRNNYASNIKVTDIAQSVGLERSYLYRLFIEETGLSPKDYLIHHRLEASKQMLQNPKLSITEVAYSCGFLSSSAFYKQFRALYKTTPKQYRQLLDERDI